MLYHPVAQPNSPFSLTSTQDKFARLTSLPAFFVDRSWIVVEDAIDTVEEVFRQVARNFTLRLAEKLAHYICSLTDERSHWRPRDWMPSVCNLLVSSNSLWANRSSHGECRRDRERAPSGPVTLCSPSNSRWGQTMATSCGSCMEPPSSPMKQGAILLANLLETRKEGRDSAD